MKKNLEDIKKWYDSVKEKYKQFMYYTIAKINNEIDSKKLIVYDLKGRIKEEKKFIDKALKSKYKDPVTEITDVIGVRVITYIENDIHKISKIIDSLFDKVEEHSIDKSEELGINKIGYRSLHKVVKLKNDDPKFSVYGSVCVEIQVRSILEHAWAEIEHDKNYKFQGELPLGIKRQLNLLAGALELIDKNINRVVEEIENYTSSTSILMSQKRYTGIGISTISLTNFLTIKFANSINNGLKPEYGKYNSGDRFIISELYKFGLSTIDELDKIIPDDIEEKIGEFIVKTDFLGLLRIIMIITDISKYFDFVLDTNSILFGLSDIKALLRYNVNINKYIRDERIYIIDDNGNFIEENELTKILK
ncbi:MAG: hypothetical protein QMC67_05655 [Candidatus Wallbacteria bacterium]